MSSGGCVAEVVDIQANYQGCQSNVHFLSPIFLKQEKACHIMRVIIFDAYICLNDINITKVNKHDEKPIYFKQFQI